MARKGDKMPLSCDFGFIRKGHAVDGTMQDVDSGTVSQTFAFHLVFMSDL